MDWLFFAFIATFLMTLVNFGDKFVTRLLKDPAAVLILLGFVNFFVSLALFILTGFELPALSPTVALLISGTSVVWGNIFYFRAIAQEETSIIIVLLQMSPLFTLLFGMLFLQEYPNLLQLVGFALILISVVAVSSLKEGSVSLSTDLLKTPVLRLMVVATFFWAIGNISTAAAIEAYVIDLKTLLTSIAVSGSGYFATTVLVYFLFPGFRQSFQQHFADQRLKKLAAGFSIEFIFMWRQIFYYFAISLGSVAFVSILGSTSVFLGIGLGIFLTLVLPAIYNEDLSLRTIFTKLLWAFVMFIGVLLIR